MPHTKMGLVVLVAVLGAIATALVPKGWKTTAIILTLAAAFGVAWFADFFVAFFEIQSKR